MPNNEPIHEDILFPIFHFLPIPSLFTCERVCRHWQKTLRSRKHSIYKSVVLRHFHKDHAPTPGPGETWRDVAALLWSWTRPWVPERMECVIESEIERELSEGGGGNAGTEQPPPTLEVTADQGTFENKSVCVAAILDYQDILHDPQTAVLVGVYSPLFFAWHRFVAQLLTSKTVGTYADPRSFNLFTQSETKNPAIDPFPESKVGRGDQHIRTQDYLWGNTDSDTHITSSVDETLINLPPNILASRICGTICALTYMSQPHTAVVYETIPNSSAELTSRIDSTTTSPFLSIIHGAMHSLIHRFTITSGCFAFNEYMYAYRRTIISDDHIVGETLLVSVRSGAILAKSKEPNNMAYTRTILDSYFLMSRTHLFCQNQTHIEVYDLKQLRQLYRIELWCGAIGVPHLRFSQDATVAYAWDGNDHCQLYEPREQRVRRWVQPIGCGFCLIVRRNVTADGFSGWVRVGEDKLLPRSVVNGTFTGGSPPSLGRW
ncbi:hypothetical protein HDV00_006665 [Rhizophlyctis rosea]|nr:hypothetical protein HDV00_006665 [Rhizophlyctis rosea]